MRQGDLIGYARVSTKEQNLDSQVDALQKVGCIRIFQEKITTRKKDRPAFTECLEFLREGDTLVVNKLDRVGRSLKELIVTLDDLHQKKIEFRSLSENIDTTSAMGTIIFHILGAFAQFERGRVSERTLEGLAAARARGRFGGRRLKLNDEQMEKLAKIHSTGIYTLPDLAKMFHITPPTIYTYIKLAKEKGVYPKKENNS